MVAARCTGLVVAALSVIASRPVHAAYHSHTGALRATSSASVDAIPPRHLHGKRTDDACRSGSVGGTARVCNTTQLQSVLAAAFNNTEDKKHGCASRLGFYLDQKFLDLPVDEQTPHLQSYCESPCGTSFNYALSDWRQWCTTSDATFDLVAANTSAAAAQGNPFTLSVVKFFWTLGCSKGTNGTYCFDLFNAMNESKSCNVFTNTCCFAEMKTFSPDWRASRFGFGCDCIENVAQCSA